MISIDIDEMESGQIFSPSQESLAGSIEKFFTFFLTFGFFKLYYLY